MAQEQLPTEPDFRSNVDDPDAEIAWKNFGGLTLDQARLKFLDNPFFYQEDFMFMGGRRSRITFPSLKNT